MKKIAATLIAFVLIITTVTVAFASNSVSATTSTKANIKSSYSPSSSDVIKVNKNYSLTIDGYIGKYYKVICKKNNKTYYGYISKNKIKKDATKYILSTGKVSIVSGSSKTISMSSLAGANLTKKAKWTSSNSNVATVKEGKIVSTGIGSATISARYKNKTLTCSVTVTQAKPKKKAIYTAKRQLIVFAAESTKSKKVAFISKDTTVNVLSKENKFYKIRYYKHNEETTGYVQASYVAVKIQTIHTNTQSILAKSSTKNIKLGETLKLIPQLNPKNATEGIEWKTSNKNIFTVSSNGTVKAVSPGSAVITVTSGSASYSVTLKSILKATSISAVSSQAPLAIGESINAYEYIKTTPSNAYDTLTIKSSNPSVAHISGDTINGKEEGVSEITITESGHTTKFIVNVHSVSSNAASPLELGNAYGNNNNYHSKCLYFENGWNGYKYWITYSPYKNFNDLYENPHIMASNDLQNWEEPKGFNNPLEPEPEGYESRHIYNSDPELVYNSDTDQLECWWRYYNGTDKYIILYRKTTSDGVIWNDKEQMIRGDLNYEDYLSPALVYENGKYKLWSVDMKDKYKIKYCEYSESTKTWSSRRTISVKYPRNDLISWHLGVIHTPKGYEMSISAFKKGQNHAEMDLYYTYSKDNIHYERADIMLTPSRNTDNWDNRGIYRSTMMYADGKYYLFYCGVKSKTGPNGVGVISGDDPYHMN